MNHGKLDRRITLQKRTLSRDTTGSPVVTWADEGQVWAEKVTTRAREAVTADADRAEDTQQWRVRFRSLNSTDYRILYDLKFYDITGITEIGRKDGLLIDSTATQSIS